MAILALYVPKAEGLYESCFCLFVAYLVLCWAAFKMKLSVPLAAALMVIGGLCGLAPEIHRALSVRPGTHDLARAFTKTDYSDSFLEFAQILQVEEGKLEAFAGMAVVLFVHTVVVVTYRARNNAPDQSTNRQG